MKYPNKAGVSNTAVNTAVNTTTGWWGGVSKTADGGKTWKQVYLTDPENDYVYFNQIACFTVDNCMVVAEGRRGYTAYERARTVHITHHTHIHYTIHYTTLHHTTLHYTILYYTTLHYTTLHYTTLQAQAKRMRVFSSHRL